jgi:hypothetical protein
LGQNQGPSEIGFSGEQTQKAVFLVCKANNSNANRVGATFSHYASI